MDEQEKREDLKKQQMPRRRMGRPGGPGMPVEKAKDFKGSIGKLLAYMGRYKYTVVLVMLLAGGSTILTVLGPKVMGKAMGLNPAILLLSLSVWGALLGFIGLIIALPLTTIIIAYWKRYVTKEEKEEPATVAGKGKS